MYMYPNIQYLDVSEKDGYQTLGVLIITKWTSGTPNTYLPV